MLSLSDGNCTVSNVSGCGFPRLRPVGVFEGSAFCVLRYLYPLLLGWSRGGLPSWIWMGDTGSVGTLHLGLWVCVAAIWECGTEGAREYASWGLFVLGEDGYVRVGFCASGGLRWIGGFVTGEQGEGEG